MSAWADLLIDVLAATRLTRLTVEDTFPPVKALRDKIVDDHTTREEVRDNEDMLIGWNRSPDAWAELIECPWCAGMWVSLGVVAARRFAPGLWRPLAKALATSMVVGLIESKIDT